MKKLAILFCSLPLTVLAEEETSTLNLNIRRIGFDLSSVSVKHARAYKATNSPVSDLTTDSQTVIRGILDSALEYNTNTGRWNNGLFMEYAKTTLKPADGSPKTKSETADKILLYSDYTFKMWEFSHLHFGPIFRGEYETEFVPNNDANRTQIIRAKGGVSLFEGIAIKDLYLVGVGEHDMTNDPNVTKTGAEFGARLEYTLQEGAKFRFDGYYRHYFTYSNFIDSDLEYDLNLKAYLDVSLYNKFKVGPYASYRIAQQREKDSPIGGNLTLGISFSYIDLFKIN